MEGELPVVGAAVPIGEVLLVESVSCEEEADVRLLVDAELTSGLVVISFVVVLPLDVCDELVSDVEDRELSVVCVAVSIDEVLLVEPVSSVEDIDS